MYIFMIDNMVLPVPPSKITIATGNNNQTYTMLSGQEINILKSAPLKEISFDFELPVVNRPYAVYNSGFVGANVYLAYLEKLKSSKQPFQLIILKSLKSFVNYTVSLENYTVTEDAEGGLDYLVSVTMKEYVNTSPNVFLKLATDIVGAVLTRTTKKTVTKNVTYTVKSGDTLWAIAKKYYGNGSKYTVIAKANSIKNPDKIHVGQKLVIPKVDS